MTGRFSRAIKREIMPELAQPNAIGAPLGPAIRSARRGPVSVHWRRLRLLEFVDMLDSHPRRVRGWWLCGGVDGWMTNRIL